MILDNLLVTVELLIILFNSLAIEYAGTFLLFLSDISNLDSNFFCFLSPLYLIW